ncbi:MAG: hypothetical protein ACFCD0_26240 [Gemmataceae bacterium]
MATVAASRPALTGSPLIRGSEFEARTDWRMVYHLVPAVVMSIFFHAGLVVMFLLMPQPQLQTEKKQTESTEELATVQAEEEEKEVEKLDPLTIKDINPDYLEPDKEIDYKEDTRIDEFSVPSMVNPDAPLGMENAPLDTPPINIKTPPGIGGGDGADLKLPDLVSNSNAPGSMAGGMNLNATPIKNAFRGRSGASRKNMGPGGGTKETEAAVVGGLEWLQRYQQQNGSWKMEGPYQNGGRANDTAATALGLLPFLGAGHTHIPGGKKKFANTVNSGLSFLIRKQNPRNGDLGGGMYAHALATITLNEAYGLTQDPRLKRPAQKAINYLVGVQSTGGGWRYRPRQPGDTSVTGWVVMALKSGRMAGLDVPEVTFRKAIRFLDAVRSSDEGYSYVPDGGSTHTMSAVGLLCRQYLQSDDWSPSSIKMINAIEKHLKTKPPSGQFKNMYYYYYATQVMHHFGGVEWVRWNKKMRDLLVKGQERDGSWNPRGEHHGNAGGRLMKTSLCLLTLEVYYRYLPLYYRESGSKTNRMIAGG